MSLLRAVLSRVAGREASTVRPEEEPTPAPHSKPEDGDVEEWISYWASLGQPWRRRAEIPDERQRVLRERMALRTDVLQAIYPFKGFRLRRDDLEWLLMELQEFEPARPLDLRGAELVGEDLNGLPLSGLIAGLSGANWRVVDESVTDPDRREALFQEAAVKLRGCSLVNADLTGASLTYADLREVKLSDCRLEGADLFRANLDGDPPANLHGARFDRTSRINEIIIASPDGVAPRLFDVHWNGVSMSGVNWWNIKKVSDEKRSIHKSRKRQSDTWSVHNARRVIWYSEAAQTYRQLSMALRSQGLNSQARRFTYRAEVANFWSLLHSLTRLRNWPSFTFSLLLGAISGWGYRLYRSAVLYVGTVVLFAALYERYSSAANPYSWREVLVLSVVAFHGRAFYPNDPYGLNTSFAAVAAAEAFVGLFIEAIIIATFTRRIFSD